MTELLRILLRNCETSRASELFESSILKRESPIDVAFLESVKSTVIVLQQTAHINTRTASTIVHDVCYPVIQDPKRDSRTTEIRQKLHLAHDLLVICCNLCGESLLKAVFDDCLFSISSFVNETSGNGDEQLEEEQSLSVLGRRNKLHLSAAIDILGSLIRSKKSKTEEAEQVESSESSWLICEEDQTKLFGSLLTVLDRADETLCAKITGGLLPFLLQSGSDRIQLLWNLVKDMVTEKGDDQVAFLTSFVILSGLVEHFLNAPPSATSTDIKQDPKFWEVLQSGFVQHDPLTRKRAMYLLKKALEFTQEYSSTFVVCNSDGNSVFSWDPAKRVELMALWQDYIILMETFDERQVHLIKPVLSKMEKIFKATFKSNPEPAFMDVSWITTLIHRATLHENLNIRRWVLCEFLTIDLKKCPLLRMTNWKFLFGPFLKMLNDNALYSRGDNNISGDPPPVGNAVVSFIRSSIDSLAKDQQHLFFKELISAISQLGLQQVPLFFIMQGLSSLPRCQAWDAQSLTSIQAIFPSMATHSVKVRGAVQCYLLKAAMNLLDTNNVDLSDITRFLSIFSPEESLCRGSGLWEEVSSWIWNLYEERAHDPLSLGTVFQYLDAETNRYLDDVDPDVIHVKPVVEALARMFVIACDAFHKNARSLSVHESTATKYFQNLLSHLRQASTHVYASESKTFKAVVLLSAVMRVLRGMEGLEQTTSSVFQVPPSKVTANSAQKDLLAQSFIPLVIGALPEVLDYLLRKLTVIGEINSPEVGNVYLNFVKEVYHVTVTKAKSEIAIGCFTSFNKKLAERCGNSILKLNIAQSETKKLSEEIWIRAFTAMESLAWLCVVSKLESEFCFSSVAEILKQFISQFSFTVTFSRPVVSKEGVTGDRENSKSVFAEGKWNRTMGEYIGAFWTCVEFLLIESERSGNACSIPNKVTILESALEALSLTSNQSLLPAMRCIKLIVPHLVNTDPNTCAHALNVVWRSFMGRRGRDRDHDSFWKILKELVAIVFGPSLLMLNGDHPLTVEVQKYGREMLAFAEDRVGVFNILVVHCCNIWSQKKNFVDGSISSITVHVELILEACLFGSVPRKSEKVFDDVREYIHCLGSSCPVNSLVSDEWRRENCVRVNVINLLLKLDSTIPKHVLFAKRLIMELLAKDSELSSKQHRCCINSLAHRKKQRIWQGIIMLLPFIDDKLVPEFLEALLNSLSSDNQASVRNIQRWIAILLLAKNPNLHQLLWKQCKSDPTGRIGYMVSIVIIIVHLGRILSEPAVQSQFYQQAFVAILPWTTVQHFQVKVFAQAAVQLMWDTCIREKMDNVLDQYAILGPTVEFIRQSTRFKATMVENFFLYEFDPIRDLSVEMIFYTLPRLTKVCDSEWIAPEKFKQAPLGKHIWSTRTSIPLYNSCGNPLALLYKPECTPTSELAVKDCKKPDEEDSATCSRKDGNIQKKVTPWKILPPDDEISLELRHQRELALKHSGAGKLVVVASLIDKTPNLGGLCRTCEIFGVEKLTVSSLHVTEDAQFKSLSVTSAKWVNMEEVRRADLKEYLLTMRRQGYTLIGVEQTANSHRLEQYQFPYQSVLVLGHEKEGIPVDIIQFLDVCVEIPQMGIVRSLNVHVSGALLIWEYTRQLMQSASCLK